MKIAVVGTIWLNTPPKGYGGTEEVIYNLVNGLAKRGHEVTFFGPQTAQVNANLIPTVPSPLRDIGIGWKNNTFTLFHLTEVFDRADNFDIIHVHVNKSQDYVSFPFSVYKNVPTLFTPHFKIPDEKYKPDRYKLLYKYRFLPFTAISKSQQLPYLRFIRTVYNSIDLKKYPFVAHPDDYFVWLGKITPLKGTKEAILAAKKFKSRLIIMGAVEKGVTSNLAYYEKEISPLIDNKQIILYQNVRLPKKAQILGHAKALLNPISWDEPFGLVMIESQATGTPVIAFKKGAAKEIIQDRKTGFLVSSLEEMVEKMGKIDSLNRPECHTFIQNNFSIDQMVEGYEEAYKTTILNWPKYYKKQLAYLSQNI